MFIWFFLSTPPKLTAGFVATSAVLSHSSHKPYLTSPSLTSNSFVKQTSSILPQGFFLFLYSLTLCHFQAPFWPYLKEKWHYLGLAGIPRYSSIWHQQSTTLCGSVLGSDTENLFPSYSFSPGKGKTNSLSCPTGSILRPSRSSYGFHHSPPVPQIIPAQSSLLCSPASLS